MMMEIFGSQLSGWEQVMKAKLVSAFVTGLAIATLVARTARAEDEVHEGKVVAVGSDRITVLDQRDDDNDTFTVTAETKITFNGKPGKLINIHAGDRAKVTATPKGDKLIAKEIVARSPE
jgi:hypothetical protein